VARVLGLPPSSLDREQSLSPLVDSLMVIELKSQIEADLEVVVPVATFFDNNSTAQLAALLLDLWTMEASTLSQSLEHADRETLAQMLAEVDELSEDEVQEKLHVEQQSPETEDLDE
jgi:hypothetical protein